MKDLRDLKDFDDTRCILDGQTRIVSRETGILTMKRAGLCPRTRTHFGHDVHLIVKPRPLQPSEMRGIAGFRVSGDQLTLQGYLAHKKTPTPLGGS